MWFGKHMIIKQRPEDFIVEEVFSKEPTGSGEYVWFRLEKKNLGTLDAIEKLARAWKVPAKNFGFSGMKDKIAVTSQVCSVKGVPKEIIQSVEVQGLKIELLGNSSSPVSLGQHDSNKFTITVREIKSVPEKKEEFMNYFGSQRFSTNNAAIGRAIVKKQWEKAVQLILDSNSRESERIEARLQMHPNDYLSAMKLVPLKLLKMYVHAYQSQLWNDIVKEHEVSGDIHDSIPIIGFGSDTSDMLVQKQLREEGITTRDFVLKAFPQLSQEGNERKMTVKVSDLEIDSIEDNVVVVKFTLPPGSYATEIIRQLFA
jgi:tRNA pseudouridine13 synthase